MFKRIWTSGSTSLRGPSVRMENIKPSTSSGKYVEIPPGDMVPMHNESTTVKPGTKPRYSFPELFVHENRPSPAGRTYMIVFHPEIGRPLMVVEGASGVDILSAITPLTESQLQLPYVIRVYELNCNIQM